MKQIYSQGLALALLLGAGTARAAVTCESAASLRAKVQACEDNLTYAKAGKACLDSYEKAISGEKEKVAKALSALASGAGQQASLKDSRKGYDTAIADLRALAKKGAALSAQVAAYKNEVVWPEDAGAAAEAGMSGATFFGSQGCYSETQKLIKQYAEIIALDARQLALTGGIASELAKKALRGESKLDTKELLPLLEPPKGGQGAPAPVKNKQKTGQSDITGTEKTKKK